MHEGRPRSKESDHGIFIFAAGYRRRGMFGGFGGFGAAGKDRARHSELMDHSAYNRTDVYL